MLIDIFPILQTTVLSFFADDPMFRLMQGGLLVVGLLDVFLLFWTLRDVLHRSQSLVFQMCALVVVFGFPFVGLLFYLLIRPSSTVREREVARMIEKVLEAHQKNVLHPHKKHLSPRKQSSVASSAM